MPLAFVQLLPPTIHITATFDVTTTINITTTITTARYEGEFLDEAMTIQDGIGLFAWPDGALYHGDWRQVSLLQFCVNVNGSSNVELFVTGTAVR